MRGYTRISVQIICISLTGRFMPLTKCYKNPRCKGKSSRARRVLSRLLCNHHHNLLFYISAPHNSPHLLFLAWALASRVEWGLLGRRVCACPSLNSPAAQWPVFISIPESAIIRTPVFRICPKNLVLQPWESHPSILAVYSSSSLYRHRSPKRSNKPMPPAEVAALASQKLEERSKADPII